MFSTAEIQAHGTYYVFFPPERPLGWKAIKPYVSRCPYLVLSLAGVAWVWGGQGYIVANQATRDLVTQATLAFQEGADSPEAKQCKSDWHAPSGPWNAPRHPPIPISRKKTKENNTLSYVFLLALIEGMIVLY